MFNLSPSEIRSVAAQYGSPVYVYDEKQIIENAKATKAFPSPFGLTARYAMKACPTAAILKIFDREGLHFDASSGYEAHRLIKAGVVPSKISLSTQELPRDFASLYEKGVSINACSLNQLERFGKAVEGGSVGLRFNPGLGSGHNNRTNVGGPSSSFGIWHESIDQAKKIAAKYKLKVFRIHTHIGSGSDPAVWERVATLNLEVVRAFPQVTHLNMGGGYKVARMPNEKGTDLQLIGQSIDQALKDFAEETGRKIHLEIEPGTFLIANAAGLLTSVQDIVQTGTEGYSFLKLDAGMTEILRPSLYGAQHPMNIIHRDEASTNNDTHPYLVVGHCCESGDILTPQPGDSEGLLPRTFPKVKIGDYLWIGAAGAYCSAMPAKNYNSFPEVPEVLRTQGGHFTLIRKRQSLEQIIANEL